MGAFSDLRIYVAVTSPYPWNRGVTRCIRTLHLGNEILGLCHFMCNRFGFRFSCDKFKNVTALILRLSGFVYDLIRVGIDLSFVFLSLDSRLICRWNVEWLDYVQMCEYDNLNSDVYDGIDFWTARNYYLWFLALTSLTDVLMILLILTTRRRDDLHFMLIEDVTLLGYNLDWSG